MYRTNDNELVVQFLERRRDGDLVGMVQAATTLWLHPVEHPELADEAAEAVWNAFVEVGAAADAVRAIIGLVRERQRVRPTAFLQAIQNLRGMREEIDGRDAELDQPAELTHADVELALELATLALDELGTEYLAPIFIKLVEGRAKAKLWPFLEPRLEEMRGPNASWLLVAFLMATTSIGSNFDFQAWLGDWERRGPVPVWLVALLIHDRRPFSEAELPQVVEIARKARASLEPDGTERYLVRVELEAALRTERWDQFLALHSQHAILLSEAEAAAAPVDHPVVRYANASKRDHAVGEVDFTHRNPVPFRDTGWMAQTTANANRVNQGIVDLAREIAVHDPLSDRTFDIFAELLTLERGQGKRARGLARELRRYRRPPALAWVATTWNRTVRKRLGWASALSATLLR